MYRLFKGQRMTRFFILLLALVLVACFSDAATLVLSGTVPDQGYKIVDNKVVPQEGSQLKLEINKNQITVRAL
jgi:hypothetical protein